MLPTVQCVGLVPGPGDAALLHGRLWSNMLVFWLQKFVALDSNGQSRIYNIASSDSGARNLWEKHKASYHNLRSPSNSTKVIVLQSDTGGRWGIIRFVNL